MDTEKDEGQTWDLSQHISVHDVDASCKFKLSKGFKMTPCPLTFERHLHSNVRQWTPTFFHFSKKHQSNIQVLRIAQMLHLSGNVPVSLSLLHTHTHTPSTFTIIERVWIKSHRAALSFIDRTGYGFGSKSAEKMYYLTKMYRRPLAAV